MKKNLTGLAASMVLAVSEKSAGMLSAVAFQPKVPAKLKK